MCRVSGFQGLVVGFGFLLGGCDLRFLGSEAWEGIYTWGYRSLS